MEAATTPLGVPFAIAVVIFTLVWGRQRLRQQPVLAFFFVALFSGLPVLPGLGTVLGVGCRNSAKSGLLISLVLVAVSTVTYI